MELKKALDMIKKHPKGYLCHVFLMYPDGDWQFGYYDESTDKITPVTVTSSEKVEVGTAEEIFKKPEDKVFEIKLNDDISVEDAVKIGDEFNKKEYREMVTKRICILQNLPEFGTVWNLTYVTQSLNTLNLKIDSKTGKMKHHMKRSLMDLRAS